MVQPDSLGSKFYCSPSAKEKSQGKEAGRRAITTGWTKCVPASCQSTSHSSGQRGLSGRCVDPPRTSRKKTLRYLILNPPPPLLIALYLLCTLLPHFFFSITKLWTKTFQDPLDLCWPFASYIFNFTCEGSTSNYNSLCPMSSEFVKKLIKLLLAQHCLCCAISGRN